MRCGFAPGTTTNCPEFCRVDDDSQRPIIAELNLRAGRRSIDLSDYNSAFRLFVFGISFLAGDHWASHYRLSVGLYGGAAEAACVLDNSAAVEQYSGELLARAKCFEDRFDCTLLRISMIRPCTSLHCV